MASRHTQQTTVSYLQVVVRHPDLDMSAFRSLRHSPYQSKCVTNDTMRNVLPAVKPHSASCQFRVLASIFPKIWLPPCKPLPAKTDFGKSMSPLVSHSRRGGAFPIMQSQLLRALGCLTARRQAQHLLKRRHDVRPSVASTQHTQHWKLT